jgi:hypothetical protein
MQGARRDAESSAIGLFSIGRARARAFAPPLRSAFADVL